ncbi:uncharacterized protein TNCV_533901 [Trichonephila clavipes]|nr:uncharacterized protein TNCV_533901 [Trichonephila clavipes]
MDEDCTTKKVFNAQPTGTRRKGRPNFRWIDGLEKDFLVLRTKNWRALSGRSIPLGESIRIHHTAEERKALERVDQEDKIVRFSNAFSDGPRNLEPWSNDQDDT